MDELRRSLVCCGVNHRTLALALRERIQPPRERWAQVLAELLRAPGLRSGVLVVTCNRVECYLETEEHSDPLGALLDVLCDSAELRATVRAATYVLAGDDALRHLFRVAAGLDSMLIGESEILAQLKEAYSLACKCGAVGRVLHRLFHNAFRVGKQVRTETELGRGARSLAGAAIVLLERHGAGLAGKKLLIIGAARMSEIVAERLRGRVQLLFSNRTRSKAEDLAERYGGGVRRLCKLRETLVEVDLVFTCTGAAQPLLLPSDLEAVLAARAGREALVICDLAVPRDVEAPAGADERLAMLDLDDVEAHIQAREEFRREKIEDAEEIVAEQVGAFWSKLEHGALSANGQALLGDAQRELQRELEYYRKRRTVAEMALLEKFGKRLVEKVCGLGIVHLRNEHEQRG